MDIWSLPPTLYHYWRGRNQKTQLEMGLSIVTIFTYLNMWMRKEDPEMSLSFSAFPSCGLSSAPMYLMGVEWFDFFSLVCDLGFQLFPIWKWESNKRVVSLCVWGWTLLQLFVSVYIILSSRYLDWLEFKQGGLACVGVDFPNLNFFSLWVVWGTWTW